MSSLQNKPFSLAALLLAALSLFWLLRAANAFDQLSFTMQNLESDHFQAQQLRFSLDWPSTSSAGYRLEIGRLELPQLQQSLKDLRLECFEGELSDQIISCRRGQLHLPLQQLASPVIALSYRFEQSTGRLEGKLQKIAIAGGQADVDFSLQGSAWQGVVRGQRLKLQALLALLPVEQRPVQGWSLSGALNGKLQLSGSGGDLLSADWDAGLTGLAFSDAMGGTAGEGLGAGLQGRLQRSSGRWQVRNDLSLKQGEMLTPAFYLNAGSHPLTLGTSFSMADDMQQITVENSLLKVAGLLSLKAQGALDLAGQNPLQRLALQAEPFEVAEIYRELLQPVLFGTPWGKFELAGSARLSLRLDGDAQALDLGLEDFHLDDADTSGTARRMGLYDVNGQIHWTRGGAPRPSWLAWRSGHLLEHIDLGAGKVDFQANDGTFRLTRQATVPVLDGALVVDRLDIEALGSPEQKLQFDGVIQPISMKALSTALGWMPLSGKLSGMIPGLTYKSGQFNIEGVLLVRMFDGDILIRQLRLQDLFGVYPRLQADITLQALDLETLTSTFSFGKITGRLDGYVRDISLEAWRPVAFNALFHTPENDQSRRRISQKAVDNISNLGGAGFSGSMARTFLGMFEEFRYKRIGIGCRLQGKTCEMLGVGEAKQGYYLVEGSGLPRIDIIGYNRTADWTRLVEQLKQITESGSPVIQ